MDLYDVKLALGAAQFGLVYGVTNQTGMVSDEEMKLVLKLAKEHNIRTIDTAFSYGKSEKRLGNFDLEPFEIITKIPNVNGDLSKIEGNIIKFILKSLERLNLKKVEAVLVHKSELLFSSIGNEIMKGLTRAKEEGLCKRVGVSVYDPDHIRSISDNFSIDLIQAPLNILDQRIIHSGGLKYCKDNKISVHIRSIFLQGLLLSSPDSRPVYFDRWNHIWDIWKNWLDENCFTPVQGALSFVNGCSSFGIERVVIGFQNMNQIIEIIDNKDTKAVNFPEEFLHIDQALSNPTKWKM